MTSRLRLFVALAAICAGLVSTRTVHAQTASASRTRPAAAVTSSSTSVSPEGVVNINTAGEDELQRLPGVGPARAAAIVALRQRVQRFRSPDDLLRVRGIGRASMRRMRPYITLTGETTLLARPGRSGATARSQAPAPAAPTGAR